MYAIADFFRVRKHLFIWLLIAMTSVSAIVALTTFLPGSGWVAVPVIALLGSVIGIGWGVWYMCAQLKVRKILTKPESLTPKQKLKKLRKERVEACLSYYNCDDSLRRRGYLDKIKMLDSQMEEYTGRRVH